MQIITTWLERMGKEMESANLAGIITLAFTLGMLHALDADHVIAVTGMASRNSRIRHGVSYGLKWAMGHGMTMMMMGMAVLLFGMVIPDAFSLWAERIVGAVLVMIGVLVLRDIRRQHLHLHFHQHEDGLRHAHWHKHDHKEHGKTHSHKHGPLMVGMLHGIAGSAPLLAMLTMSIGMQTPWYALLYLLIFSLAVMFSMLLFGGVLSFCARLLQSRFEKMLIVIRMITGTAAMIIGGNLVLMQ